MRKGEGKGGDARDGHDGARLVPSRVCAPAHMQTPRDAPRVPARILLGHKHVLVVNGHERIAFEN